jgi:hypothetical protein
VTSPSNGAPDVPVSRLGSAGPPWRRHPRPAPPRRCASAPSSSSPPVHGGPIGSHATCPDSSADTCRRVPAQPRRHDRRAPAQPRHARPALAAPGPRIAQPALRQQCRLDGWRLCHGAGITASPYAGGVCRPCRDSRRCGITGAAVAGAAGVNGRVAAGPTGMPRAAHGGPWIRQRRRCQTPARSATTPPGWPSGPVRSDDGDPKPEPSRVRS